eukprot:6737364-Lingulodinium_polyedra.AAC.1
MKRARAICEPLRPPSVDSTASQRSGFKMTRLHRRFAAASARKSHANALHAQTETSAGAAAAKRGFNRV